MNQIPTVQKLIHNIYGSTLVLPASHSLDIVDSEGISHKGAKVPQSELATNGIYAASLRPEMQGIFKIIPVAPALIRRVTDRDRMKKVIHLTLV